MHRVLELLENLNSINPEDGDVLKQLSAKYPYASIIQLLYSHILKKQENYHFNTQLKLTAAVINSRSKLFNTIHGNHNIKVHKFHNEPVYVQSHDKIDDLIIKKENTHTKWLEINDSLSSHNKAADYADEKVSPDIADQSEKTDKIPTENAEPELSAHQIDIPVYNIAHGSTTDTSVHPEDVSSKPFDYDNSTEDKTKVEEVGIHENVFANSDNKNPSENTESIDTIRKKIRERFGTLAENKSPKDSQEDTKIIESETASNQNNQTSPVSEKTPESTKHLSITPPPSTRLTSEKSITPKQDAKKVEFPKTIPVKNEKLEAVQLRASKILENLEKLKSKYGSEIKSESIEDEHKSPDNTVKTTPVITSQTEHEQTDSKQSIPTDETHPVNADTTQIPEASESNQVISDYESAVEFDLTESTIPESTDIILDGQIETSAEDLENSEESDTANTEWILEDEETLQPASEKNENHSAFVTTDRIIAIKEEQSDEAEDIFMKWLAKISENTSKRKTENQDIMLTHEISNSKQKSSTKSEKFKIIDNFLSGNIQIKPKTDHPVSKDTPDLSQKYTVTTPDLMTETLAELYIAQGHTEKAIQALEILKLKNPEKSSYFARRIQDLKKKK